MPVAKRVLFVVTYYLPYLSGLTKYAQRLALALRGRGWEVWVLTSQHRPQLPREEWRDGVRIVRAPVWARLGKGVLMPGLFLKLLQLVRQVDLVFLILPQAEAGLLAWLVNRRGGKPLVVALLCDVELGPKPSQRAVEWLLRRSHLVALHLGNAVVALSHDYTQHLPWLFGLGSKLRIIPPPVPFPPVNAQRVQALQKTCGVGPEDLLVGWVGRVSREKGLDVLARAMPLVWEKLPQTRVLCAGPREEVVGESAYRRRLERLVASYGTRWIFTGPLPDEELGAFYAGLNVLAFPSVSRTEALGMVQVEAMACGTPVVASDLPGVREPVMATGMGMLVPPGEPNLLAAALIRVLEGRKKGVKPPLSMLAKFLPDAVGEAYHNLFLQLAP